MRLDQNSSFNGDNVKERRKAEELYRNQMAQADARKADLLKKQRKIQECQEQIQRMDRYAERCLLDGQEKKAAIYLERKLEWESRLAVLIQEAGFVVKDISSSVSGEEPVEQNQ